MKVVLDCDTGIDDAMAIIYAALHEDIDLVGVGAVWGNVAVGHAAANSLDALEMAGASGVPVAVGAAGPVDGTAPVFAPHVHGASGRGPLPAAAPVGQPIADHAARQIVRVVREHPGEVMIVAVGPLTNVALALALEPALPSLARGITVMGGAAAAPGNVTPAAEANIWCDPVAAHAVFAAEWHLTLVPLDVTMRVLLTEEHRLRLAEAGSETAAHVASITDYYFDFFAREAFGQRCSPMHDVLALAVGAGTWSTVSAPTVHATVDTSDGPSRGATIVDLRGRYRGFPEQEGARCTVALDVEPGFPEHFLTVVTGAEGGGAR